MQLLKNYLKAIVLTVIWINSSAYVVAEESKVLSLSEGQSSPPASIDAAAWMAGNWAGDGLGGLAEESYLPPNGGSIIGMFRQMKDGKPSFYEFVVIAEYEGSLIFRIKHFDPDMRGWEAQDEATDFPLVKVTDDALYFDGLTYMKTGPDSMSAYVRLSGEGDEMQIAGFHYRRIGSGQ